MVLLPSITVSYYFSLFFNEEDDKKDKEICTKIETLQFVTTKHLELGVENEEIFDPCVAGESIKLIKSLELNQLNSYFTPGDKLDCIYRSCKKMIEILRVIEKREKKLNTY